MFPLRVTLQEVKITQQAVFIENYTPMLISTHTFNRQNMHRKPSSCVRVLEPVKGERSLHSGFLRSIRVTQAVDILAVRATETVSLFSCLFLIQKQACLDIYEKDHR